MSISEARTFVLPVLNTECRERSLLQKDDILPGQSPCGVGAKWRAQRLYPLDSEDMKPVRDDLVNGGFGSGTVPPPPLTHRKGEREAGALSGRAGLGCSASIRRQG